MGGGIVFLFSLLLAIPIALIGLIVATVIVVRAAPPKRKWAAFGKYLLYSAVMTPGIGYVGLILTAPFKEASRALLMIPTVAAAMCVAQILSARSAIRSIRGETKTSKPRPGTQPWTMR